MLKLRKIVYLWRCFSLARKLLMRRFRGSLNYILNVVFEYMLQKNIQWQNSVKFWESRSGTKVALFIYNFTNFSGKTFFKFSLNFAEKILESRVFLKSSLLVVYRRPLEWLWHLFLGREICCQSWAIICQKSTKFQNF